MHACSAFIETVIQDTLFYFVMHCNFKRNVSLSHEDLLI